MNVYRRQKSFVQRCAPKLGAVNIFAWSDVCGRALLFFEHLRVRSSQVKNTRRGFRKERSVCSRDESVWKGTSR